MFLFHYCAGTAHTITHSLLLIHSLLLLFLCSYKHAVYSLFTWFYSLLHWYTFKMFNCWYFQIITLLQNYIAFALVNCFVLIFLRSPFLNQFDSIQLTKHSFSDMIKRLHLSIPLTPNNFFNFFPFESWRH